jgi:3-oxoacid CoA-transferase subunit B
LILTEVADGITPAEVQARTDAKLTISPDIQIMVAG